jgi:Protein of unknown function (DUF2846)
MFRTICTFVAAALLFGCAATTRDGLDYSSVAKTYGGPKKGEGRIVVLLEKGYAGVFDQGYPVSLDNEPIGELRTGTFVYGDRPPGRHELSVNQWDFPGVTKQEVNVVAGRTYFFVTKQSERSKAMKVGSFAGLTGMAVTAIATSGNANPGPVDFDPLDEAAGMRAISELRLAQ